MDWRTAPWCLSATSSVLHLLHFIFCFLLVDRHPSGGLADRPGVSVVDPVLNDASLSQVLVRSGKHVGKFRQDSGDFALLASIQVRGALVQQVIEKVGHFRTAIRFPGTRRLLTRGDCHRPTPSVRHLAHGLAQLPSSPHLGGTSVGFAGFATWPPGPGGRRWSDHAQGSSSSLPSPRDTPDGSDAESVGPVPEASGLFVSSGFWAVFCRALSGALRQSGRTARRQELASAVCSVRWGHRGRLRRFLWGLPPSGWPETPRSSRSAPR